MRTQPFVVALVAVPLAGAALLLASSACTPSAFVDALPTTLTEVDRIRNDTTLSAQEMRDQLAALGLSDLTINALLRGQRTGNQFGGTLRTAFTKVTDGALNTLTPDEIQLYSDAARTVDPNVSPELDDAQGQAIADLLGAQGLATADVVSAFLANPANEAPAEIPSDVLQTLFIDFVPADIEDQL